MKLKLFYRFLRVTLIVATMMISYFNDVPAFAAETKQTINNEEQTIYDGSNAVTRAGQETLPLGLYLISKNFTITNNNLTPIKTVQGRYMRLIFSWSVSTEDKGLGGEIITIKIKDAETGNYIDNLTITDTVENKLLLAHFERTFDLGYAGRKIQIFTDVSSLGESNGHYRSADFYDYQSFVYN